MKIAGVRASPSNHRAIVNYGRPLRADFRVAITLADLTVMSIYTSIGSSSLCVASCMGRSRGGLTSKIHALVDAAGRPITVRLTAGPDCRLHARRSADRRPRRGRHPAGRQGLRQRCDPRQGEAEKGLGQYPAKGKPQGHLRLLGMALSSAKPRRTLLQPDQKLPGHRHPIRQGPRQLPRPRQTRRSALMVSGVMSLRPSTEGSNFCPKLSTNRLRKRRRAGLNHNVRAFRLGFRVSS